MAPPTAVSRTPSRRFLLLWRPSMCHLATVAMRPFGRMEGLPEEPLWLEQQCVGQPQDPSVLSDVTAKSTINFAKNVATAMCEPGLVAMYTGIPETRRLQ